MDELAQAHKLLQDALHIFDALVSINHPQLKLTLRTAALSAAEMAVAVLKGERCSCHSDSGTSNTLGHEEMNISAIPPVEDTSHGTIEEPPLYPSRYTEFVATIMPAIRAAYPHRAQQENITQAAQLWHAHKHHATIATVVSEAEKEIEAFAEDTEDTA